MSRSTLRRLIKQGGGSEPFSVAKLRRCIEIVVREMNRELAAIRPLVEAVEVHVAGLPCDEPVTTAYVLDCICTVLTQTGLEPAAERLRAHRDRRHRCRQCIRVVPVVTRDGESAAAKWEKARLADSIRRRAGVGQETARIIAAEVESRVLMLGYRTVSTALIEALSDTALAAWGLSGPVRDEVENRACGVREPIS